MDEPERRTIDGEILQKDILALVEMNELRPHPLLASESSLLDGPLLFQCLIKKRLLIPYRSIWELNLP